MELSLAELRLEHNKLDKKVAKMERERDHTRDPIHKEKLKQLKREKLALKDQISKLEYNFDEHFGGVETFK